MAPSMATQEPSAFLTPNVFPPPQAAMSRGSGNCCVHDKPRTFDCLEEVEKGIYRCIKAGALLLAEGIPPTLRRGGMFS